MVDFTKAGKQRTAQRIEAGILETRGGVHNSPLKLWHSVGVEPAGGAANAVHLVIEARIVTCASDGGASAQAADDAEVPQRRNVRSLRHARAAVLPMPEPQRSRNL